MIVGTVISIMIIRYGWWRRANVVASCGRRAMVDIGRMGRIGRRERCPGNEWLLLSWRSMHRVVRRNSCRKLLERDVEKEHQC